MSLDTKRFVTGIKAGTLIALFYSAILIASHALTSGANVARRDLSLLSVLLVYFVGGIGGGVVYGLVGPLMSSRLLSPVGWLLITAPIALGAVAVLPEADLSTSGTWATFGILWPILAGMAWFVFHDD